MGSRSRIRWHKVLKLGMGVFGCLALFLGLPNLIRRPEPPPLEPDIGLVHVAASREPAPTGQRPAPGPERRPGTRPEGRRRLVALGHPTSREGVPPSTGSPVTGAPTPAPAPVPVPVSAADTAPPPAPPAPPAPAPPPARAVAPQPAAQTEFGFER